MRACFKIVVLSAIALSFLTLSAASFAAGDDTNLLDIKAYRLGSGDKISIHVFGEDDLNLEATVSDSGTISYPFLGELKVKGITLGDLEGIIIAGLKGSYLVDPEVNVTIKEYRPFFIHGEVKQNGSYPYQPGLTLRKAITLAGGFTERASKTKMTVIRELDPKRQLIRINLDDPIYPGDTVTIEDSFF